MQDARSAMGVAVFDADADGKLDLFYTNFRTEYNALMLNRLAKGFFSEQTEAFGLTAGSLGLTKWGEKKRIDIRLEAFNVFNHANFRPPSANIQAVTVGIVSSTLDARIIQFALKLHF